MINANELMIGNWVIMPYSPKPQQVKSIEWKEMDSGEFDWYISGNSASNGKTMGIIDLKTRVLPTLSNIAITG